MSDRRHPINYYDQAGELTSLEDPVFDVLRRLQKSFDSFFRRVANGETPGYPRYKTPNRYHSFVYPQATGFSVNPKKKGHATLRLGNMGHIDMRYHRPIPKEGRIKTCAVLRKNRKWYAIISVELPDVPVRG